MWTHVGEFALFVAVCWLIAGAYVLGIRHERKERDREDTRNE
jgi:hypothetical protein